MSLPRILKTTVQTIPATIPYVHADPALAATWCDRIGSDPSGLKVGVCWAGKPTHKNDRNRSIPIEFLKPLSSIGGIKLFSVYKGAAGASSEAQRWLEDHSAELNDFADTAALLANLDLVLSVDTSVAHLAGALGKPVWLLLPFVPDWRWLLDRDDSPWYPTMRLYRQPAAGDWISVVARMAGDLENLSQRQNQLP